MLTTGQDIMPGLKGSHGTSDTSGNDIINGFIDLSSAAPTAATTFNGYDQINGGGGTNIFKLAISGDSTGDYDASLANVEKVQVVEINNTATGGKVSVDTSANADVTDLKVTKSTSEIALTAANTQNVSVAAATDDITIDGGKDIAVSDSTVDTAITIGATTVNKGTITVTDTKVGTGAIAIDGGTDVTVNLTGSTATGALTIGAGGAATDTPTGAVKVTSVTAADVNADTTMHAVTITGGSTVEVTQTATSTKAGNQTDAWTAVTVTQGAVSVTGANGTSSVTINQTKSTTKANAVKTVAAVTETNTIKFGALKSGDALIIGSSDGTLSAGEMQFTAAKDLTAAEVAQIFAHLANPATQGNAPVGNGVYTLSGAASFFTTWTSAAASGDSVTFTSTAAGPQTDLDINLVNTSGSSTAPTQTSKVDGVAKAGTDGKLGVITGAVTINDDATTAAIKTINLDGYGATTIGGTNNVTKLETLNLANSGGATAGATDATVGVTVGATLATLNLGLNNVKGGVTLTGAGLKTLNINTSGANSATALVAAAAETLTVDGDKAVDLTGGTLSSLKTVTVKNEAGLTINASGATVTAVNTTATTGKVVATIDATKATYTGGNGVDEVTTSAAAPTKAISLGKGADKLTLASGTTSSTATLDGGDGEDTLVMVAANAVSASGDTAFAQKVINFEILSLTGATGAQAIDVEMLGNYSKVSNAAADGTLTLNNMADNGTLTITGNQTVASGASHVVNVKGAADSTTNVFNIETSSAAGVTAGAVKVANVETINVTATDSNSTAHTDTLTVLADKATTVTVGGNAGLTLTLVDSGKVTAIDGSSAKGALTLYASNADAATTITGGDGNDSLYAGMVESASVEFGAATAGQTVIIGGLTWTDDGSGATAAEVAADFASLVNGASPGAATHGTFTGTLTGWSTGAAGGTGNVFVTFTSAKQGNVTDLVGTGTAGVTSVTTSNTLTGTTADILSGGKGNDTLYANAGMSELTGGEGRDTFVISVASTNVNSYSTIKDFGADDLIQISGASSFKSAKVTLGDTAVFQDYANAAINALGVNEAGWFQFGGNTYIVADKGSDGTTFTNGEDFIVKLVGTVDLTNASFDVTTNTIGLTV